MKTGLFIFNLIFRLGNIYSSTAFHSFKMMKSWCKGIILEIHCRALVFNTKSTPWHRPVRPPIIFVGKVWYTRTPSHIIHHRCSHFLKMQPYKWDINCHQWWLSYNTFPVNGLRGVPGFGTVLVMDCGTLSFMSSTHSLGKKPTWREHRSETGRVRQGRFW